MSIDYDSVTDNQELDFRRVYRETGGSAAQEQGRDRRAKEDHQAEAAGNCIFNEKKSYLLAKLIA